MADSKLTDTLTQSPFFKGLEPEFIAFLAAHAEVRRYATGEVIFHHGARADRFYLVLSGRATVEVAAIEGPALELQNLGPNEVLGWSWLISPHKWAFQARVEEPAEIVEFDGAAVLAHCEEDPRFGYALLKRFSSLMSERLRLARLKMMQEWKPPGFA